MKKLTKIISLFLALWMFLLSVPLGALSAFASGSMERENAMEEIEKELSDYRIGTAQKLTNDGYIGIPVEISVYFDKENHTAVTGYNGTPLIIYVVNTMVERIGTESDVNIIRSLLNEGYIVYVLDYMNNSKAVSQALDFSVQILRKSIEDGIYRPDTTVLPGGYYYENFVVPAGYTVSLGHVFYEIDKHAADGTLEKIVEIWNNDFKTVKGESLVRWVHTDGSRKTTANASDGSVPVWYNASGKVDANGQYTKVKYTVASVITDCTNPDGSPIELNQYMHIVYPTGGVKVPVMTLANSAGRVTTAQTGTDVRPHMNGFLFNGYAGIVYDYMWTPMARNESYGYFDGSQGSTGDHMNYAVQTYNNIEFDTAAMRYIRYLALSQGSVFNFDTDAIGVIGNSKGGWFTFLGEAVLRSPLVDASKYSGTDELEEAISTVLTSFRDGRVFPEHNGESRYENGITKSYTIDGFTVDGGEKQPWLTYDGKEILSGANFIYTSNGANQQDITEGYAPSFVASHMYDDYNAAYGFSNALVNLYRNMDIPSLFFEVPLGHALTYGEDMNYGVDTYDALFDFAGYYLKHDAVKVVYTSPINGFGGVSLTGTVTVKFTGPVDKTEIEKITVTDGNGITVNGAWTSAFGNTEWRFAPIGLKGSTVYTITVPSTLKGGNGKAMGADHTSTFSTECAQISTAAISGSYVTVNVAELKDGANKYALTFRAANDAANIAQIYAVSSTSDTDGTLVGSVNLKGAGYYSVDVTAYAADKTGQNVIFLIKEAKTAGENVTYNETFDSSSAGTCNKGARTTLTVEDGKLKAVITHNKGSYTNSYFYPAADTVFSNNCIKATALTDADYGRRFRVSFDVYDDLSRYLMVRTNGCTSKANDTMDYQCVYFNTVTKAGEWKTVEFEYVVYDTDYGVSGIHNQGFTVLSASDGADETPLYFDNIKVTEVITGIEISDAALVMLDDGGIVYKTPEAENTFILINGGNEVGTYASLSAAMNAYKNGYTLKLGSNCTLTDSGLSDKFADFNEVVIDLNGYRISCENTAAAFIWIKNTSTAVPNTRITVKNGELALKAAPAVAYDGSTSAGAGKQVNVDFENVVFTFLDNASLTEIVSASSVSMGANTTCHITLDECTFALDDAKHAVVPSVILPTGNGGLTLSYEVIGGKLELSSQRYITVQTASKHSEFLKSSDGYMTLRLPSARKPADTAYMRDDGYSVYADGISENGYTTYTLYKSKYATRYGMIPEKYADEQAYPLVVFDTQGNCLGASSYLAKDSGGGAFNYAAKQSQGEWIIYLRRDLTHTDKQFNNLAFVYGSVLFDLGGNTVTVADGAGRFLDSGAKRGGTTAVTLKNGTVSAGGIPFVRFTSITTSAYDGTEKKTFDYTFENITFTDISAKTLFDCGNSSVAFSADLSFNDCTFDLTGAPDNFVLINLADASNLLSANVNVSGGLIKSDTFEKIRLYGAFNSLSSIIFTKNSDGNYMTAQSAVAGAAPADNIPTPEGNMLYEDGTTSGDVMTYTLNTNPLATKYGVIPTEYADAQTYPFIVFTDGVFYKADTSWALAVSRAKDALYGSGGVGKEMQILMRRDYTSQSADDTWNLWNKIGGNVVIDLNGFTFTRSTKYFIDISISDTVNNSVAEQHNINIKVINGKILSNKPIMAINRGADNITADKRIDVIFDCVTVKPMSDAAMDQVFVTWNNGGDFRVSASLVYNNCVFDLSEAKSSVKLFAVNETKNLIDVDIRIAGGSIIASALSAGADTLFLLGSGDTAAFVRDETGRYTTLTMPASATVPDTGFATDNGEMSFGKTGTAGSGIIYSLVKLKTEYGTIPAGYASPLDYPFVYFDKDGNFKGAYSLFYGNNGSNSVMGKAKDYLSGNIYDTGTGEYTGTVLEAYILMRRDYELSSAEKFDNLAQIQGGIHIDLGGYTLTGIYKTLFPSCIKGWSGSGDAKVFPTTVTVGNGNIVTGNYSLIEFSVWNSVGGDDASAMLDKVFTYNFNNVSFGFAPSSEYSASLINYVKHNSTPEASGITAVNFNDCTFDLGSAASGITVFNADPTQNGSKIKASVSVNGGTVILSELSGITFGAAGEGSSLTYGKGSEGKYIIVNIPVFSSVPTINHTFTTAEGELTLKKLGTSDGTAHYTPAPALNTAYGGIPAVYADVNEYPFAVFMDGKLIGAYASWKATGNNSVNAIKGAESADKTVYVLLRRDYTNTGDTFWTLTQAGGTFVLDLGGYVFTRDSVFMDLSAGKYNDNVFPTNIVVKNGTALALKNAVMASQYQNTDGLSEKVFNITFDNVYFGFAEDAVTNNLMWIVWDNGRNNPGGKVNAVFNSCTFDFSTNAPTGKTINVFNFKDTYNSVDIKATVNGGKFIASDWSKVLVLNANSGNDLLVFGKYNDKYTSLTLTGGALDSAPDTVFATVSEGRALFRTTGDEGEETGREYLLMPCRHSYDDDCDPDCNDCGEEREISHKYDAFGHNDTHHWKLCSLCGTEKPSSEEKHTGGTATCTERAVCEKCGVSYGGVDSANHTGKKEWTKTDRTHEQKYSCCGAVTVAVASHKMQNGVCTECGYNCIHTGGTATCTEKATCTICGQKYGDLAGHTYKTEWSKDSAQHWYECSLCGTKNDEADHAFEWKLDKNATVTEAGLKHEECGGCGYMKNHVDIGKLAPDIIDGNDVKWNNGGEAGLIFRSNAAYADFVEVLVDGNTVASENYDIREGSIIVELKPGYLATLAEGEHRLTIRSASGDASTSFTVNVNVRAFPTAAICVAAAFAVAVIVAAAVFVIKRKSEV